MSRLPAPVGMSLGLVWNEDTAASIKRVMMANPRAGVVNVAAYMKVSYSTMRRFIAENPDCLEIIETARAHGDNMISQKNFTLAMKGDSRALDREMKRRGMIGADLLPVMPQEVKRDYSNLSVEELEMMATLDAKTRPRITSENTV